jgi:site-specific DNA recombinase
LSRFFFPLARRCSLGRDTRVTLEAVAELEACGVAVRSMTEEFDSQSPSGRLMMTLLSGFIPCARVDPLPRALHHALEALIGRKVGR